GRRREALAERRELLLEDLRDARQDADVLALDGREAEPRVDDQLAALRDLGHLEPRRVDLVLEVLAEPPFDRRMADDATPEAARHPFHGYVVVRRAHTTRREHDVEARVELADRGGDRLDVVGDRQDAEQGHAEAPQLAAEERRVGVDDLAREDLVADDDDARGPVHGRPAWLHRDRVLAEVAGADLDVHQRRLARAERALERGPQV